MAEWSKAADLSSVTLKFVGWNPTANKILYIFFQANIIFGKTIENVRDYSNVKLHNTKESALKAICKHTYKSHVILSKTLVQTNHFNEVVLLNKPIAIGVSILELVSLKNSPPRFEPKWSMAQLVKQICMFALPTEPWRHSI